MNYKNSHINSIKRLKMLYKIKKPEILSRLEVFKNTWNLNDNKIFAELCFCITTPQSKAEVCNEIIKNLERKCLLFKGGIDEIMPYVKKARFYKTKSKFIVAARNFFQDNGKIKLKNKLDISNNLVSRDWLVKNVKGIGYKEASHFLRNIGFGENLAILDVHILKNLQRFDIIKKTPRSLTKNLYLDIEKRFKKFSNKIKIPMSHLDLLFWSMETGKIFK